MDPLPQLGAADLRRGRVLHQPVERHRALAAQPRRARTAAPLTDVRSATSVMPPACSSTPSRSVGGDPHVVAPAHDLVRLEAQPLVEDVLAGRHQAGVRHPGAVEAVADLAPLVLPHRLSARLAATGSRLGTRAAMPPMAWAPRRWQVRTSSSVYARMNGVVIVTCDAVGQHDVRPVLDEAEDVVPAAGVQPGRVLAQLVEDLVHLERRRERLDQHGRPDGAPRDARAAPARRRTRRSTAAPPGATSSFGR